MLTTVTNDWLGSRLKTLYITILRIVNGEKEWQIYGRVIVTLYCKLQLVWKHLHF